MGRLPKPTHAVDVSMLHTLQAIEETLERTAKQHRWQLQQSSNYRRERLTLLLPVACAGSGKQAVSGAACA